MDKRTAIIKAGQLLDMCEICEDKPMSSEIVSVATHEEKCGHCAVYQEMKEIRPFLTGDKRKPKPKEEQKIDMTAKKNMTVEEYVQLHYVEGKSNAEIAEINGRSVQTIYNFRKKHKGEIDKLLQEKGLSEERSEKESISVAAKPSPEKKQATAPEAEQIDWEAKYNQLKQKYIFYKAENQEQFDKLQKLIHENAELRDKREQQKDYIYSVEFANMQMELDRLREENKHLKGLVKLWIV